MKVHELLAAGPTVSFEFFPPKSDGAAMTLGHTIAELEPLEPSFVSVTYGAGGSTRDKTRDVVKWVQRETKITAMAHLTCVGHSRAEVAAILESYTEAGVQNILALLGDPPGDEAADEVWARTEFDHAIDLVRFVRSVGDFSIGVAAHPEVHPKSTDRAADRGYLADKLAEADFGVSQFFFDPRHYFDMVAEVAARGIDRPVVPGVMPVTNLGSIERMANMSGAALPQFISERLRRVGHDPAQVRAVGIDIATELCTELLRGGVPGLHLYTLNRSTATREIHQRLPSPAE